MLFSIPVTHDIEDINILKGTFIFLHRASKTPPHIGLILGGIIFEISANGPGYNLSGATMLRTAQKRGVELLILELTSSVQKMENLEKLMTELVKRDFKVTKTISCLSPIKDFVQNVYDVDLTSVDYIFELLPILYANKLVKSCYEVNLSNKLIGSCFLLNNYTKQDIESCIDAVNRKNIHEVDL